MNKKKNIVIILLVAFGVLMLFRSDYWTVNGVASIWISNEKEFSKPVDVVWQGEIISTMADGSCVGLKGKFDKYDWAMACLSDLNSNELWKLEGMVTITGKWLGITCAYKNTIFGECVPDVIIKSIEK